MKVLSLYIERWYIIAAVCCDNIFYRIKLPNGEDRIWLYFYEDINNNKIIYGKTYQQHFLSNEEHYHGDIFSRIVKEDETFERFGISRSLKDIFKDSDIFEHLKKEFLNNKEIETYVSFSADITYAAQKVFLDILKDNNFNVQESVARISHLALELSSRKGRLKNATRILTIIACNENLRYVVYRKAENIFVREADEGVLLRYGIDLRGRALLEQIVSQINGVEKFLNREEEEFEMQRLAPNLGQWLRKLDTTKHGRPVIYEDITFSRLPYNKKSTQISTHLIEERTRAIVERVVDSIVQYVQDNNIQPADISHVLFLGSSFNNTMFKDVLLKRYLVNNDNIIIYQDEDLPEIVSIYSRIDLSQFYTLREHVNQLSEEELIQIREAEHQRQERERAAHDQEQIENANAIAREEEKNFNTALQEAENYEKKGDYNSMIDLLKVALTIKPDSTEVKQLLDEANRKVSEIKVRSEQFNKAIRGAKKAFEEQRWEDAYSKSESALELRMDSSKAKQIKEASQKKIRLVESLKEFLLRADIFIGQKLYDKAMEELNKAKLVDANNKEITQRIKEIVAIQNKQKRKIDQLVQKIDLAKANKNFEEAIEYCNKLLNLDSTNQRKWSGYIIMFEAELNKVKINTRLFDNLMKKINLANYNEEWKTVINLCNEAILIKDDEKVCNILRKAEAEYQIMLERQFFEDSIGQVESLMADKAFDKARSLTNELQKKYPQYNNKTKQLFKRIFEAQDSCRENNKDKMSSDRFQQDNKPKENDTGFFADDFSVKKESNKYMGSSTTKKKAHEKVNDDFFDDDFF